MSSLHSYIYIYVRRCMRSLHSYIYIYVRRCMRSLHSYIYIYVRRCMRSLHSYIYIYVRRCMRSLHSYNYSYVRVCIRSLATITEHSFCGEIVSSRPAPRWTATVPTAVFILLASQNRLVIQNESCMECCWIPWISGLMYRYSYKIQSYSYYYSRLSAHLEINSYSFPIKSIEVNGM